MAPVFTHLTQVEKTYKSNEMRMKKQHDSIRGTLSEEALYL
uniref:Uncharacterized protein n=1 Tax=Arundo donax TaxID=35708 RepID=A0A0A9GX04_ARUDO